MRSAIHYPDTQIKSRQSMASALLLWDKLKVIVPYGGFNVSYDNDEMAAAWELIGGKICPDEANKQAAHTSIEAMLKAGIPRNIQYRDDLEPDQSYEIWPQKLAYETWRLLKDSRMTAAPLANGDYPFEQAAGIAIMSKIADACAGNVYARVTDKMLAYGLIADRDEPVLAQSHVVPMTLDLIDASSIPLERLIEFRRRESKEGRGGDYAALRHNYADSVQKHVQLLSGIQSENQREQLDFEFGDEMARHLKELSRALGVAKADFALKPVIVTALIGAGTVLTGGLLSPLTGLTLGSALNSLADLFKAKMDFSEKQRKAMETNPMAYMYQLAHA